MADTIVNGDDAGVQSKNRPWARESLELEQNVRWQLGNGIMPKIRPDRAGADIPTQSSGEIRRL
ncbi:hypothetical protein DK261_02375 [Pseudomonas sp. RW409]|nr:hypothetical protein DK261_02375 [Pseudomonas sp. RW409]